MKDQKFTTGAKANMRKAGLLRAAREREQWALGERGSKGEGGMKTLPVEQAALEALRGEKIMVGVYGEGVNIMVAIDRADVAEHIREFTDRFPERDPLDMAKAALRAMMLLVGLLPLEAQAKFIAPALLLADSAPDGIDGVMGIEVTIRKKGFQVEIFDLGNLETPRTVH